MNFLKLLFGKKGMVKEISAKEAKEQIANNNNVTLIDVREKWEHDIAKVTGAKLIPMRELSVEAEKLDKNGNYIVMCHHGSRSFQAALFLMQKGFTNVQNLSGGINAWSREADKSVPTY